jgi:hypothetical protein
MNRPDRLGAFYVACTAVAMGLLLLRHWGELFWPAWVVLWN